MYCMYKAENLAVSSIPRKARLALALIGSTLALSGYYKPLEPLTSYHTYVSLTTCSFAGLSLPKTHGLSRTYEART